MQTPRANGYRAVRWRAFPLSRAAVLVVEVATGRAVRLSADELSVLHSCRGLRSLADHALGAVRRQSVADYGTAWDCLNRLIELRLLVRLDWPSSQSDVDNSTPIATVGIVTRDRPAMVARCLKRLLEHAHRNGRSVEILVVDSSGASANRRATRQHVTQFSRAGHHVHYLGMAGIQALQRRCATAGVERATVEFALGGGGTGANRNVLLLMLAGNRFLMVDDDIVLDTWSDPHSDAIAFVGHEEIHHYDFFETREEAVASVTWSDIDLLANHGSLLGRSMADILGRGELPPDMTDACACVLDGLVEAEAWGVRLTFPGLVGDSGMSGPQSLLLCSGQPRSVLANDERRFRTSMRSRELRRIAPSPLITHASDCMAGCMGVDNRQPLVPFIPFGRGEDTVFGQTLAYCAPRALFGHFPHGIVHDSMRGSPYDTDGVASRTTLSEIVQGVVRLGDGPSPCLSERDNALQLGRLYRNLRLMNNQEFGEHATASVLKSRSDQLRAIEARIENSADYPHYWKQDLQARRAALLRSITERECALPTDFVAGDSAVGFGRLRDYCAAWGEVISSWHDLAVACAGPSGWHDIVGSLDDEALD